MQFIGYLFLIVCVITAAVIFYYSTQSEYHRNQIRARIAGGFNIAKMRTRGKFSDEKLKRQLLLSGLNIRASVYNYFRILLSTLLLVFALVELFSAHIILSVILPILAWYALEYRKPFPMYYGFRALQKQAAMERNKYLFLLYRLIYQEILIYKDKPNSIQFILERQLNRVGSLRPFLNRCLEDWIDSPVEALKRFGEDVGTKQAKTLAQMLVEIQQGGIKTALDVFKNNHESFRTDRIAAFRAKLSNRALIGTALVMIGFGAVMWDLNIVIQIYTNSLMKASMH